MSPTVHGQLTSGLLVHSQVVRLRHAYAPPIIYAKLISLFTAKHEVGGDTLLRRKSRRGSRETLRLTRSRGRGELMTKSVPLRVGEENLMRCNLFKTRTNVMTTKPKDP
jgi:hypothetical protein